MTESRHMRRFSETSNKIGDEQSRHPILQRFKPLGDAEEDGQVHIQHIVRVFADGQP